MASRSTSTNSDSSAAALHNYFREKLINVSHLELDIIHNNNTPQSPTHREKMPVGHWNKFQLGSGHSGIRC